MLLKQVNLTQIILSLLFYISVIRSTSIGLFYPAIGGLTSITHITLTNYILFLLFLIYILLSNNYKFIIYGLTRPLGVFCVVSAVLTTVFSMDIVDSIKFLMVVSVISFSPIIYARTYGIETFLNRIVMLFIIFSIINLLYIIAFPQYAIMSAEHAGRWKGLFMHKNAFGSFFAITFFIMWNQFINFSGLNRILLTTTMILSLIFIIMSGSATAYIIFILTFFTYVLFMIGFRFNLKDRVVLFLIATFSALLVFTLLSPIIAELIFQLTGRDATLTGRTDIWAGLFQVVLERPFLGYGAGMSARADFISQYQDLMGQNALSSHSAYLDLLLNYGIIVPFIIIAIILKFLFSGIFAVIKHSSDIKYLALAGSLIISSFFMGISTGSVIVDRSFFWVFMLIGILIIQEKRIRNIGNMKQKHSTF